MTRGGIERFLAPSARGAERHGIRDPAELIARPEILDLAGGLPPPDLFPVRDLAALIGQALERQGASALQYGPAAGDPELRHALVGLMREAEGPVFGGLGVEQVLVTAAGQQALDLCARLFLGPEDVVVCERPTYAGALHAFAAAGAGIVGIPLDREGLRTDLLEQRLIERRGHGVRPKLIYTVPDFHDPTGVTLSRRRREELLSIAREFDLLVIEDCHYRPLRYTGHAPPCLASLDRDGRVLSLFSSSRVLAPGLRLGWVVADPEIVARLALAKQSVDLGTNGLVQLAVREFLKAGLLPAQLARVRRRYAVQRDATLAALERHLDPTWGVRWTRPEGGLFLWVELPAWLDGDALLARALEERVALLSGRAFHEDGSGAHTLRLSFAGPDASGLELAVERLAGCIDALARRRPPEAGREPAAGPARVPDRLGSSLGLSEVVS
jgi:2-aminoadipate transaminase